MSPNSTSQTSPPTPSLQFPHYLLPSLPFLPRGQPSRPRGHLQTLQCRSCQTTIAPTSYIISKGFMGRHGRAYLLSELSTPQVSLSPPICRPLVTGMHTVSDVACALCGAVLGWKYLWAEVEAQKYKVGKYILEKSLVEKVNYWEGAAGGSVGVGGVGVEEGEGEGEGVAVDGVDGVDSADEDELEDLFLGVWTKEGAAKRRKAKEDKKREKEKKEKEKKEKKDKENLNMHP